MRFLRFPRWLRRARVRAAALLAFAAAAAVVTPPASTPARAETPVKPNLLFVLTDDQRSDSMALMDETLLRFNVDVPSAFVTTPTCCPSRASFLTGRYARNTGVLTNSDYPMFEPLEGDSLAPWLQDAGYFTGFVGRYMNRYPTDAGTPPGWDEFHAVVWDADLNFIGDGYTQFALRERWWDGLHVRDEVREYGFDDEPVYATEVFADIAERFIRRAEDLIFNPSGKPWALFVWPNAPHPPLVSEPQYAGLEVAEWRRPPSFLERDMSDKPKEVRRSPFRSTNADGHLATRAGQLRMLESVDDLVQEVFGTMDELDVTDSTWGVYSSDNGRFWGEHGLREKFYAYEESIHVPFRMAIPEVGGMILPGMVTNVDLAPTFLALAGDTTFHPFDGVSLLPLVDGTASIWRTEVFIENWQQARYRAIRTARWKYVRWLRTGHQELYDLLNDPFELKNVAKRRKGIVLQMRGRLRLFTQAA